MGVILIEDHRRIIRKIKKRAFFIHLVGAILLGLVLIYPILTRFETDLVRESYRVVREHLVELEARYILLDVLRNKPLTVGQALQIADVLIEETSSVKVPVHIVLGVISVESSFRPNAVSSEGARGLMQIMPAVWNSYIERPEFRDYRMRHDPGLNIRVGVRYLSDLFKRYGDWKKVLRVYGGFINSSPDKYVSLVLAKAEKYRNQIGGSDGSFFKEKTEVSE